GSAFLELFICSSVGDQPGLPACRRHKLWCKRLRPCKVADKSVYYSIHCPISAVLDTCRTVPGTGAFYVYYNSGSSGSGATNFRIMFSTYVLQGSFLIAVTLF